MTMIVEIHINGRVTIPMGELSFRTSRSGGPGGQNVNKVATQVELLFDVGATPALTPEQRARVAAALAGRIDTRGVLHVTVDTHRSQARNKEEAIARFAELLRRALIVRRARVATKVPRAARERRLATKKARGETKRLRRGGGDE